MEIKEIKKWLGKEFENEEKIKEIVEKINSKLKEEGKLIIVIKYMYDREEDVYKASLEIYNKVKVDWNYRNNEKVYFLSLGKDHNSGVTTAFIFDGECELRGVELHYLQKRIKEKLEEIKKEKERRSEREKAIKTNEELILI